MRFFYRLFLTVLVMSIVALYCFLQLHNILIINEQQLRGVCGAILSLKGGVNWQDIHFGSGVYNCQIMLVLIGFKT